jgi:hypothetical protein
MKEELMDGAPAGSISSCHPSGWIQIYIFTEWLDHFVHFVQPSVDDPVLLIVDGRYSHTKSLDVVDKARKHIVALVTVLPLSQCCHCQAPTTFYAQNSAT